MKNRYCNITCLIILLVNIAALQLPAATSKQPKSSHTLNSPYREIFLPEILLFDLASGELTSLEKVMDETKIKINSKADLNKAITKYGKGDFYYDYKGPTGYLFCIRGSSPSEKTLPNKQGITKFSFQIKNLPQSTVITTQEGHAYKITVLSADIKGCKIKFSQIQKTAVLKKTKPSDTLNSRSEEKAALQVRGGNQIMINQLSSGGRPEYMGISSGQWQLAIRQTVSLADKIRSSGPIKSRPKKLVGVNTVKERLAIYRQFLVAKDRKALDLLYEVMSYGGDETLPVLIEGLDSPKVWVRRMAVSLLGDRGFEVTDHLIKVLLNDVDPPCRQGAAMALASLQCSKAVPHLIKALKDKDRFVLPAVIRSLAYFPEQRVFDSLVEMLKADIKDQRNSVISSLNYIDHEQAKIVVAEIAKTVEDKQIADRMIKSVELKSGNLYVWPEELAAVVKLAKDALTIAGETYSEKQIQLLIEHVNDDSHFIRSFCIRALAHIGDVRAVPAIIDSCNKNPCEAGFSALISFGTTESVKFYVEKYIEAGDLNKRTMAGSLISSSKIAVPMLMVMLNDFALHRAGSSMQFMGNVYHPASHRAHSVLGNILSCNKFVNVLRYPRKSVQSGQLRKEIKQIKVWWHENSDLYLQNKKVPKPPTMTSYFGAS
jgi:HEAT repeat protein